MTYRLLQWNCRGVRSKKDEILEMIKNKSLDVIALQETKLWRDCNFNLSNYNSERVDGHVKFTSHGGVAFFIHSSIPYTRLELNTSIQAVAIKANIGNLVTICNIY